jgi:uncharacterized protein (TIGR03663 family)
MKWERAALLVALAGGAMLRLGSLDLRPMHTDEAVHAIKFGDLLENGTYRYDRHEYHGPTLNYFTLVPAWLTGEKTLSAVSETTLRSVPALFGICLLLLILLLPELGPGASACAALLTAFSPAMVFYSRYYVQETLLVCFAFGLIVAAWRRSFSARWIWTVMAGVCAGLMCATKETWIISAGTMGMAMLGVWILRAREDRRGRSPDVRSVAVALLCAGAVWVLFFSSFFSHWEGVWDSLLAYDSYFTRAGENDRHGHPWFYFLKMLTYSRGDHGPLWTEAGIVFFGVAGLWGALREKPGNAPGGRDLRVFLGLCGVLMLIVSSAIPYKTPWLVLGALQPLIISAGCGLSAMIERLQARRWRVAGLVFTGLIVSHLGWQAWMANFRYFDDPVNPYVYSHPGEDVRQIAAATIRAVQRRGSSLQVVCGGDDYWPLPWYFRTLPHVGWWGGVGEGFVPTGVILASPEFESAVLNGVYETPPPGARLLYVPLFDRAMFLRPGKELRGYITLDLRNDMLKEAPP